MKAQKQKAFDPEKWAALMGKLCDEQFPAATKLSLLSGVKEEEITGAMLAACTRSLLQRAHALDLKGIDVCGTGGDRNAKVKTFNVSTAVAFVAAAGGVSVIKHGNKAVSGVSGSSDVLAALHVTVCTSPAQAKAQHEKYGVCFVSAPAFHPALAMLAPVRKALGKPSFLNLLGPLSNPARTQRQVIGVFDPAYLEPVTEAARLLNRTDVICVHSEDGLDEFSVSAPTHVCRLKDGKITHTTVKPEDALVETAPADKLRGGSAEQNAAIIHAVFSGTAGPLADIVALNAGAAFVVAGLDADIIEGVDRARGVIADGKALKKLTDMKAKN
jgi:anthranilate phosphoribosyltransferase